MPAQTVVANHKTADWMRVFKERGGGQTFSTSFWMRFSQAPLYRCRFKIISDDIIFLLSGNIIEYICFWRFNSIIMTWNKWLSLYEISYYGIEQHITLTLPAGRCLFTVRNYMTLFNTFVLMRSIGLEVWFLLGMAMVPGSRRRHYSVVSVIFLLLSLFCTFCSLFHTMANISIFLSHWHSHINFYFPFSQFMCRC